MRYKVIRQPFDLFSLCAKHPKRYPFLLDSQGSLTRFSRFKILMGFVEEVETSPCLSALNSLDEYFKRPPLDVRGLPDLPFYLGYFIYLGFEAAPDLEPKIKNLTASELPNIYLQKIKASLIFDRQTNTTHLIARNQHLLDTIENDLKNLTTLDTQSISKLNWHTQSGKKFIQKIKQIQHHLTQGDNFQTNIARKWQTRCQDSPFHLYQKLSQKNPAPFSAFANIEDHYLLSCSPERLLHVKNKHIHTKPIAGTIKADNSQNQTQYLERFKKNPKECAEHAMIVDLLRNDMNKICKREVKTNPWMAIETYPHLHHIVSTISGELEHFNPSAIIKALFPGGSVTGCPKIKTIEIINQIEKTPRSFYTGSMGYICETHQMDLNILIRTLKLHKNELIFYTGAGIVIDSIPEQEDQETKNKAQGILNALQTQ